MAQKFGGVIGLERLLIIDDDEVICNGLHQGIPWEENGIAVVGVAYDGEMALEFIKERTPDIVLVDINLPFLDGLELSGIIRRDYPGIKVILITAHEEFEFAKKAVQLHVYDYITKPLDNQKVLEAVRGARENLAREREAQRKLGEGLPLIKEKYLGDLLKRNIAPEQAAEMGKSMGLVADSYYGVSILNFKNCRLPVAARQVSEISSLIVDDELGKREIFATVQGLLDAGHAILVQRGEAELVMIYRDFAAPEACARYMENRTELIRSRLATVEEYFFTISLGRVYQGVERIASSYEEAKLAAAYGWRFENRSILRFGEIDTSRPAMNLNFDEEQLAIINGLKMGQADEVFLKSEQLFSLLKNTKGLDFSHVRMIAVELVVLACKAGIGNGGDQSKLASLSNDIIPQVIGMDNIAEVAKWVRGKLAEVMSISAQNRMSDAEKMIKRAVVYIDENFANSQLTLDEVAKFVHLSPAYFSMLFRQIQRVNFSDYLETLRIQKAAELFAHSQLRIYEVAERVGYNSPQYFSICFKKITGCTPSEFKTKQ
ncbi:response regulator [Hydrogenispora ethanolica]|uniref:response regulator n=1 Tax=Hydrogenispora ethanolica TaxID=1082276 RepID=UPI0014045899|nr:response regulator [Hydrogenispora ethanolica]